MRTARTLQVSLKLVACSALVALALILFVPRAFAEEVKEPPAQPTAAAAAKCYNITCKGKNPRTEGCESGTKTIEEFTRSYYRVELRYSANCFAAWARISTASGTPGDACNAAFGQIRGYDSADKRKGVYGVQAICPGSTYTRMWPFGDYVRACLSYDWFTGDPDSCTRRR